MKKSLFVLCLSCLGSIAWVFVGAQTPQRVSMPIDPNMPLKIIFDNDVHGVIDRYEYLAGYRDVLQQEGYPVLTVSVGDFLQGSAYAAVSQGQFCMDMINAVGYDVVAVGNHDLDYGLKRLLVMRDSLQGAAMVCANLMNANNEACLPAFAVKNIGSYRVAFVGVLTTATEQMEAYAAFDRKGQRVCSFANDSLVQLVQNAIDIVRLGEPDWVVLLTHMGVDPLNNHLTSWQLVEQLHGVDLVLDGHSHTVVNTSVMSKLQDEPIAVAQTGYGLNNIGCVTLTRGEQPHVMLYAYKNLPQSPSVQQAYQQVVDQMQPILGKVVGSTPYELHYHVGGSRAVRRQETNLGDLVADAYKKGLGTDIGWVNGGGIRTGIERGQITFGQILSVSPFNNFMCVAQVTGQQLVDALEESYHVCPAELGAFAHISGIRCVVDTSIQNQLEWDTDNVLTVKGKRRVSKVEIYKEGKWHAINMKAHYTIASTDYVVYEGESRGLKSAKILKDKVMTDTECLLRYITKTLGGTIPDKYARAQGRIMYKK